LYLTVAVVITWPLVTVFSTHLLGHPFGDSYEYAALIWWLKRALQTGQPLFFQPLLAYPDGLQASWLWDIPLQSFPAWLFAFVLPLPAAFNLSALIRLALNGWAMYWLVWKLTDNRFAACIAGTIFLAYPTFQGQLAAGHIGLLALWPMPFYVYALTRLSQETGQTRRYTMLGAGAFAVSAMGSNLLLVFLTLPVTALFTFTRLRLRDWTGLRRVIVTAFLGGIVALVFVIPGLMDTLAAPPRLRERDDTRFSADLLAIVSPSFQHPVFGALEYTHRVLGVDPFEKAGYIGIVTAILAFIGLWKRPAARKWLLLAAGAWLLSLGGLLKVFDTPARLVIGGYETHIVLPWALFQNAPLLNIVRTPARFNFVVALAVAIMAGYGAAVLFNDNHAIVKTRVQRAAPIRWAVMLILVGFILWEYQLFWTGMPTIPGVIPEAITALKPKNAADIQAVFDVPWAHLLTDKDAMYLQTGHEQPLLAGHIARRTPVSPAKLTMLQNSLDLALLKAVNVGTIILHKQWAEDDGQLATSLRDHLGAPFYDDERIAAFHVPATTAQPGFTSAVTPDKTLLNRSESYLYAPESGWATFSGSLQANGRTVSLYLDDMVIYRWTVNGDIPFNVALPVANMGYHTAALVVEPPCPAADNPTLRCRVVTLSNLNFNHFTAGSISRIAQFEHGVELAGANVPAIAAPGSVLHFDLWWRFSAGRNDQEVRFIHVQDANGKLVAQTDQTLGSQPADGTWSETISLPLPADLPPGIYTVRGGWYTYPDLNRFCILAGSTCSTATTALIGTFTVGSGKNS
jgi:hypothetical protein